MTEEFFRVGVISSTHGLKGEVKVFPTTDDPQRFKVLKEIYLDTGKEKLKWEVESVRFFKNMVILKFKGFNHINDIEKYKGMDLLVTRDQAVPLEEGEFYFSDVMEAKVITQDGKVFGTIKDVLSTGANEVFVVDHEGKEVLLPVIPDCVLDMDLKEKVVTVHIMKGLMD